MSNATRKIKRRRARNALPIVHARAMLELREWSHERRQKWTVAAGRLIRMGMKPERAELLAFRALEDEHEISPDS